MKQHIRYIRGLTFGDIDLRRRDPLVSYRMPGTEPWSNLWFSGCDGHTVREFTDLLRPDALDRLERDGGICIVYTHFASGFVRGGSVDGAFEDRLRDLAMRPGWFVPAGTLLDRLTEGRDGAAPGYGYLLRRDLRWLADRVRKKLVFGR